MTLSVGASVALIAALLSLSGTASSSNAIEARTTQTGDVPGDTTALVVLVHGLGRTSVSMLPLEFSLERAGYRVLNYTYNSYGPTVAEIGERLASRIAAEVAAEPPARIHFVGHSLGNIVIRWVLTNRPLDGEAGRFVMLAPPNRGARTADRLAPYFGWLLRPLAELETVGGTAVALPPLTHIEFAIVAGAQDGKVRIEETCLAGAVDHVVVPSGHTFILMRPDVIDLIKSFLASGSIPPEYERTAVCEWPAL